MLVLEGRGGADAEAFRAAGIGDFDLFEFEREGKRPDGTPVKVAFALAFALTPAAPDVGFFTCLHRHPENFWNPAFQVHANTAAGVAGVVLVADDAGRSSCLPLGVRRRRAMCRRTRPASRSKRRAARSQ